VDQNLWDGKEDIKDGELFQLGVDLAKYQDWTVLTPFSLHTFKAHQQDRFNQVDWNLQKAKIEAAARRLNDAKVVVDSTGVGDPIAEDLERTGLEVESFKFTEISRKQLLDNLAILLEQDKIKIPNDEGLISELKSMTYRLVITATGKSKLSVQVPEGMTDDRIISLALAVWGVDEPISLEKHHVVVEDYKPLFESIGA
jgi:phage FluMu gp28-like protein